MFPSGQLPASILALARISKPTGSSITVTDRAIHQGRYQVFSKLDDLYFPDGLIDWDIALPRAEGTSHLYLHSLTIVDYALGALIKSGNPAYLDHARHCLEQWLDYARPHPYSPGKKATGNAYLWYDHTVPNRARVMIHFYCQAAACSRLDQGLQRKIVEALHMHAQFMIDPQNYRKFNHGLMMDRALLLVAMFIHETEPQLAAGWTQTAVQRLREGLERDFTREMIHRENSAGYHLWAIEFFRTLIEPLRPLDPDFAADLSARMEQAEVFLHNLIQPDGNLAPVGDTLALPRKEAPRLESQIYPQAGVAIFAQRDEAKVADSTWIHFKAGYSTHTHKHADDLSFILHAGGHPVFIDPGMLSYSATPASLAFAAATAHNTLIVDDTSYPIERKVAELHDTENLPCTGLSGPLEVQSSYSTAGGFNRSYAGVLLTRRLVFLPPNLLVIHDLFACEEPRKISQLFHVGPGLKVARATGDELLLQALGDDARFRLRLRQLVSTAGVEYACGDAERHRGFQAEKFDVRKPLEELAFTQRGVSGEFITIIGWNLTEDEWDAHVRQKVELKSAQLVLHVQADQHLTLARELNAEDEPHSGN